MGLYRNKRIYDVFVSATMRDLRKHRRTAIEAIRDLGHRAIGMERFDARAENAEDFIFGCIKDCDIFIAIIGKNTGSLHKGKPYVPTEYEYAVTLKKPILAFALDDEEVNTAELPQAALDFRTEVLKSGRLVGLYQFNDINQLQLSITRSLEGLSVDLENKELGGWVRSEAFEAFVPKSQIPPQIITSNVLQQIIQPICQMDGIIYNLDHNLTEKEAACEHFLHSISVNLSAESGINRVFIDGGSTTFQFCRSFNGYCKDNAPHLHKYDKKKLVIGTNSLLNFIELANNAPRGRRAFHSLRLYPAPPVSKIFGKSFGDLENVAIESEFSYAKNGWRLSPEASKHIESSVAEFGAWLSRGRGKSITIISAAGFLTDGTHLGPWVKDHSSMLQQQGMFRARQPLAIILDSSKWQKRLGKHEGYPVLFDGISWQSVMEESPIAVAFASMTAELIADVEAYFREQEFEVIHDVRTHPDTSATIFSILAFNDKFLPTIIR